jgi:hypothetical protein
MDEKLYLAKTKTGFTLLNEVSLSYLETKLVFSLNDLVGASSLQVGEELKRPLRIKTKEQNFYSSLSKRKEIDFLITIQRIV